MAQNSTAEPGPGYRYQIIGGPASGLTLVDTWGGIIIDRFIDRIDANRAVAEANRAFYRRGTPAQPAGRRRAHIGNAPATAPHFIDPLFRLAQLEAGGR